MRPGEPRVHGETCSDWLHGVGTGSGGEERTGEAAGAMCGERAELLVEGCVVARGGVGGARGLVASVRAAGVGDPEGDRANGYEVGGAIPRSRLGEADGAGFSAAGLVAACVRL